MADPNYELAEVVQTVMKGVPYAGQSHILQHQLRRIKKEKSLLFCHLFWEYIYLFQTF